MTGFNMPPGCNVSDIPGNRPEDMAAEAFAEEFSEQLPDMDDEKFNIVCAWVFERLGKAYQAGYHDGMSDEAMAREQQKEGNPK